MNQDKDTLGAPRGRGGFGWYQADTAYYHEGRLQKLVADTGVGNLLFFDLLMREAYASGGYYLEWQDGGSDKAEAVRLAVSLLGVSAGVIEHDWLPYLLRHGFFDREMFRREGVLTSRELQERYVKMCRYWKRKMRIDARFCLLTDDELSPRVRKPRGEKLLPKDSAELLPTSAETKCTSAEMLKTSAELERTSAETDFTSAEMLKTSAETKKTSAELEKTSAETDFTSAEMLKTSAEPQARATVGIFDNNNNDNDNSLPLPPRGCEETEGVTVDAVAEAVKRGTSRREDLRRIFAREEAGRAAVTTDEELEGLVEEFIATQRLEAKRYRDLADALRHLQYWLRMRLERRRAVELAAEAKVTECKTNTATGYEQRQRGTTEGGGGTDRKGGARRNSPEEMARREAEFQLRICRELAEGGGEDAPPPWL